MADIAGVYIDTTEDVFGAQERPPVLAAVLIDEPGTLAVTQQYLMQAWDSVTNQQYDWLVTVPDWTGVDYPGPNSPTNIAIAGIVVDCPTP